MPFTFSHPAAILPFLPLGRNRVSVTALAIGSMAPDFEFFLRMRADTDISHSLAGTFLFNLPMTLALAFLYHCWVKEPFLAHLPEFIRRRVNPYIMFNWTTYFKENWVLVIVSSVIGIASHFFCDAFTHHYGWFVNKIPFLEKAFHFFGKPFPVYHGLQYLSSLIFGLILIQVLFNLPKQNTHLSPKSIIIYWVLAFLIMVVSFLMRLVVRSKPMIMDDYIMTLMAAGMIGVIVASSFFQLQRGMYDKRFHNP